jgi:hypothetical protein
MTCKTAPAPETPLVPVHRGRPKDSPDVWTPEHIAEVAQQMWEYIESTDYPSIPGFCYLYGIRHQRLGEFEELRDMKDLLFAKRQANIERRGMRLGVGEGALGSFIQKLAANAGPFSLTDKTEVTEKTAQGSLLEALEEAHRARKAAQPARENQEGDA